LREFFLIDLVKKYYWQFESVSYEWITRLSSLRTAKIKHPLPSELIISLTSYPPRFSKLHLTLKCLVNQSVQPDQIILWIAKQDIHLLPPTVLNFQKQGLVKINACKDFKVYKKIIPTLQSFPKAFIVTADDDLHYPKWWLEALICDWDGNVDNIVAHRVHGITLCSKGNPLPYKEWVFEQTENCDPLLAFPTGGAGVLYTPDCFYQDVQNEKYFTELCNGADDIWLFWMCRLKGKKTLKSSRHFNVISWTNTQHVALAHDNYSRDQNDIHIANMFKKYGWPIN
jgi:protein O-GlcNAc transferase